MKLKLQMEAHCTNLSSSILIIGFVAIFSLECNFNQISEERVTEVLPFFIKSASSSTLNSQTSAVTSSSPVVVS